MAGVLMLSLALAWAVSRERRIPMDGLSVVLPGGWSVVEPPSSGKSFSKAIQYVLRDAQGDITHRLVLARLDDAFARDADAAYQAITGDLTGRWDVLLGQTKRSLITGEQSGIELRLMGLNRDFMRQQDHLHLLSLISSGDRIWAIYMEEIIPTSGFFARTVIPKTTLQLFDRLLNGVRLESVLKSV